jgi:hypothetical protein
MVAQGIPLRSHRQIDQTGIAVSIARWRCAIRGRLAVKDRELERNPSGSDRPVERHSNDAGTAPKYSAPDRFQRFWSDAERGRMLQVLFHVAIEIAELPADDARNSRARCF